MDSVAVDSAGNVYAGGYFTAFCTGDFDCTTSTPVNRVAMWDGTQWNALADGVGVATSCSCSGDPDVIALAVDQNNHLYAGGDFVDIVETRHVTQATPPRIRLPTGTELPGLLLRLVSMMSSPR